MFSRTDHVTDSERFYNSVLELLDDPEEKEEIDQLITWWNRFAFSYCPFKMLKKPCRQIFPLYADADRLPSKNSVLARIRQKRAEYRARLVEEVEPIAGPSRL